MGGLGCWNSPLFGVYLAPFVWLALRHGLAWRREVAWFAGALLGSLPTALYEAVYFPSTRFIVHAGGSIPVDPVLVRAATVFGTHVPDLLGVPEFGSLQSSTLAVSASLLLLGVAVALCWDRAELRWLLALGDARGSGRVILWIVLVSNLVVVIAAPQGAVGSRYLHPLYAVLPAFAGIALAWLWRRRRSIAVIVAVALIGIHGWHNWTHGPGGTPSAQWRWSPTTRALEPLVVWLESRGIGQAYWAFRGLPPSYEMTYLAAGRVVFADPWRELALPYARRSMRAKRRRSSSRTGPVRSTSFERRFRRSASRFARRASAGTSSSKPAREADPGSWRCLPTAGASVPSRTAPRSRASPIAT